MNEALSLFVIKREGILIGKGKVLDI
jgi:hypothetical protein